MIKINKAHLKIEGDYPKNPNAVSYFLECRKANERLFDGRIFILKEMAIKDRMVEMSLFKGSYSDFLYNNISEEKVQPIGVDVLLETKDNYYLLCKMADWTYTAGKIKTVGGNMDEQDEGSSLDPSNTAVREIKEELGMDYSKEDLKLRYLYSNPSGFVSLAFQGKLEISRIEAENIFYKWKERDLEKELESLYFLKKDRKSIEDFLKSGVKTTRFLKELLSEILKDKEM